MVCSLYRHFDADNQLLYVGISIYPIVRLQQHRSGGCWTNKIARVEVQAFASREEAFAAELEAIHKEHPLHNKTGKPKQRAQPQKGVKTIGNHQSIHVHPGAILREDVLPALGRPKTEIARLLGVSRQTLYDILGEDKPVTSQMALRLAKMLGVSPNLWLNLQRNYDLAVLAPAMEAELAAIPALQAA